MVDPDKPEKKQEQEQDNFEKERQAALGIVSQLVRYAPTGGSLWIFGSFIKDRDWPSAVITFPIMVIMVAWSAYSKGFLLKIQERMDEEGRKGADSLIQQVQKLDSAIREAIKLLKIVRVMNYLVYLDIAKSEQMQFGEKQQ